MLKIDNKITGWAIARKPGDPKPDPEPAKESVPEDVFVQESSPIKVEMNEGLSRPEVLMGCTYKIKTPLSEHAIYVTINDMVLNAGTAYESRWPREIFINSKAMEHYQWIVALTRIISAVFRKGGEVVFLVDELRSVFDPKGGYFKKGGKYMPSLVAEIGDIIEMHLKSIGMISEEKFDPAMQRIMDEKRKQFEAISQQLDQGDHGDHGDQFPDGATLCDKCQTKALVLMDGCQTCLNCGYSKCG